jgi:hypothetical protein
MSKGTTYLNLTVDEAAFDRAIEGRNHSARCMIAQALKAKYGPRSNPIADSDYIRFTNPATGERLIYRTPPDAAAALLSFDNGIKPRLPLHIRARLVFQKRSRRPATEASIKEVRDWAATQDEFSGTTYRTGTLSSQVISAYQEAHPDKKVRHQGVRPISISASHTIPKLDLPPGSSYSEPRIGNLAGGSNRIPESRRRTWGSRKLTSVLIEQGWTPPES